MNRLRVAVAELRLAAPEGLRSDAEQLRRGAAETFLPSVLAAAERRLRARFGKDAVIRLPQLDLRLQIKPDEMFSDTAIEAVGHDIAEAIAGQIVEASHTAVVGISQGKGVLYRDKAERVAHALAAAVLGHATPEGDRSNFVTLWQAAEREPPEEQAKILVHLAELKRLPQVLSQLSHAALAKLAGHTRSGIPAHVRKELARSVAATGVTAGTKASPPASELRKGGQAAAGPAAAQFSKQSPPAADMRETSIESPPASSPSDAARESRDAIVIPDNGQDFYVKAIAQDASRKGDAPTQTSAKASSVLVQPLAKSVSEAAVPTADDLTAEEEGDVFALAEYPSRWCALPGLLNISLELELPERLWRVGVNEGGVLAAIFARLSSAPDDAAIRMVGAAFPEETPFSKHLPRWAEQELVEGTLAEASRLYGDGGLADRIAALSAFYGHGGFDLAAWGAALHLALAERRLGETISPATVAERFARGGRIATGPGIIRILQPMEAVDIALRLGGLDINPGWLAWLEKRLEFVFEGPGDAP